jgi:hypothetical protein
MEAFLLTQIIYLLAGICEAKSRMLSGSSFVNGLMTTLSCTFSLLSFISHTGANPAFNRFCRLGDSLMRDAYVPAILSINCLWLK